MRVVPVLLLALAAVLAGCSKSENGPVPGGQVAAVAPPAGQQWTDVVATTPEGGVRMGNPEAAVKLVEYASFTCPHCADFTAAGAEALRRDYVATGKLSWEFRPFLLNGLDVVPSLLTRCQGPGPFFKLADQVYAAQSEWVGKVAALPPEQQQAILPDFAASARATGLDAFFRSRGLPQAKLDACLADKAAAEQLVKLRDRGTSEDGVQGTPSFLINGTLQENTADWPSLRAKLADAVG